MNTNNKAILPELSRRKSSRSFLDREIEPEKLDALWTAAQWSPSSRNAQEWHYYAVMGSARRRLASVLNQGNQWALKAPLILGVARDMTIPNKSESREYGIYDVALSVMSLVIEAEHQGLRAHQIAGFSENALREALDIPSYEAPVVMVAVGYEGSGDDLDSLAREKELRPRERKPINEIITIIKE